MPRRGEKLKYFIKKNRNSPLFTKRRFYICMCMYVCAHIDILLIANCSLVQISLRWEELNPLTTIRVPPTEHKRNNALCCKRWSNNLWLNFNALPPYYQAKPNTNKCSFRKSHLWRETKNHFVDPLLVFSSNICFIFCRMWLILPLNTASKIHWSDAENKNKHVKSKVHSGCFP